MRKILALVLAALFCLVAVAEVPAYEDIEFPEVLPGGIIMADDSFDYSYDDMTQHYDISLMVENYGSLNVDNEYDPILYWLEQKFNVTIKYSAVDDLGEVIPALAAADDLPDVFMPQGNSRDVAFSMDDAGKLIDASELYPYMPLSAKYTTKAMIANSTNPNTGRMPFITGYHIQDGIWSNNIRVDWLEKAGMDFPTNEEELKEFAEFVKTGDPDGNGVDDTYLFGIWRTMRDWCQNAYGNSAVHVDEDGKLSHQYFNGVRYGFLNLCKELVDAGYVHPDWAVTDWNQQKVMTAQDKLAALYYPAGTQLEEFCSGKEGGKANSDNINAWGICAQYPFGDGEYKYPAAGAVGYRWCFPVKNYEGQDGKLLRVLHMIDTMRAGGENYFQCIQNSIDEVYQFYADNHEGVTKNPNLLRSMTYTPDGYFYITVKDLTPEDANDNQFLLGNPYVESYDGQPWQQWGLAVAWQLNDPDPEAQYAEFNNKVNSLNITTASLDRYPNTDLMYTLSGEAAEANNRMGDWILAQEWAFIRGEQELTEETYAAFAQEWLDRGGYEIVAQMAEGLGCELPDELVK